MHYLIHVSEEIEDGSETQEEGSGDEVGEDKDDDGKGSQDEGSVQNEPVLRKSYPKRKRAAIQIYNDDSEADSMPPGNECGESDQAMGEEQARGEGSPSRWDSLFKRGDAVSDAEPKSTKATTEAALLEGAKMARRSSERVSKRKSQPPTRIEELRFPLKVTFCFESKFSLQ